MKFAQYIPLAVRTCKPLPLADHINHMGLGIAGEMGEIIDQLKKANIYGKPLDQTNIVEEVGDVAWYIAGIVNLFPELHDYLDQDSMAADIDQGKLASAKEVVTRAVLLNNMAMSNLIVDLGMLFDQLGDKAVDDADVLKVAKTMCKGLYALALLLDVNLDTACDVNIAKLAKRYGDKYSDYAATNRDIDAERAILEAGTA